MLQNEIPIEGVLKYIKRERDKYKEKLEKLIPYTKNLEERFKDLTARNLVLEEALKDYTECKKMRKRVEVLEKEKEELIRNNSALISDYKQSDWYKDLHNMNKKLREENKELLRKVIGL